MTHTSKQGMPWMILQLPASTGRGHFLSRACHAVISDVVVIQGFLSVGLFGFIF
jgi:hypothetical protein